MVKGVLFDMDGTLIDSFDSIVSAFKEAFGCLNNNPKCNSVILLNDAEIRRLIGTPHNVTMRRFCADEEALNNAVKIFRSAREKMYVKPFEGAVEILEYIRENNMKSALITTTGRTITDKIMRDNKLENLIDAVVTKDDVSKLKPDPEPILKAMEILNLRKEECIMVGDHPNDILASKNAGVKSVAVKNAYSEEELRKYNPDYIIENLKYMKNLLENSLH